MLLCRFRQFAFKMYRWMKNWYFSGGIRRAFSGIWVQIMRLFWGLLAIGRMLKGPGGRREPGEEDTTSDTSFSEKVEVTGEANAAIPVQEPEQERPCAVKEDSTDPEEDSPEEDSPEEYSCEYDSTWDTDVDDSQDQRPSGGEAGARRGQRGRRVYRQSYKFERFQAAARDLQNYRHNYPIKPFHRWNLKTDEYANLDFYLGNRSSSPDYVYIGDFHTLWRGQYDRLESVHSYIQWLFPLQEPGVNPEASTLTKEEIEEFCQNDVAKKHLLESYKLMLDFYGIELCDERTGEVKRALNWINRFTNLNSRNHNNLRITRILKCLGTLGFAHYQAPLVRFFLEETLVNEELPRVKDSVLNYFLFTVLDKKQRRKLLKFAYLNFDKREEFVWCPIKIQRKWAKQSVKQEASQKTDLCDNLKSR